VAYTYAVRVALLPNLDPADARKELIKYLGDILTGVWEIRGTTSYRGVSGSYYCIFLVEDTEDVARMMLLPEALKEKIRNEI